MSSNVIGIPRRRVDGRAKATGQTRYADDLILPRMVFARLLRSPEPHARVLGVDTAKAAAHPGVHLILTGKDLPIPYGILPVTQAGVMEILPNHTFQPAATVRRIDLARVVSQLLTLVAAERQIDLARWRAARPRFPDLPATNQYYNAAALALASGAMDTREGDRFLPTQPVTGADLVAAIDRIEQLAGR